MPESYRVLLADDHPINRLVFQEIFQPLGCSVEAVEDGEQAISKVAGARYDLVCLDRHMPGLSGDEVAALLPSEQLVVVWSTDLMDLPARFNGILSKPLTAVSAIETLSLARRWRDEASALIEPAALLRQAR